jgi:hypothetical protein
VQLQNQRAILHQLLIGAAAVSSAATEQALIPAAAGFDIGDTDKRLSAHSCNSIRRPAFIGRAILQEHWIRCRPQSFRFEYQDN